MLKFHQTQNKPENELAVYSFLLRNRHHLPTELQRTKFGVNKPRGRNFPKALLLKPRPRARPELYQIDSCLPRNVTNKSLLCKTFTSSANTPLKCVYTAEVGHGNVIPTSIVTPNLLFTSSASVPRWWVCPDSPVEGHQNQHREWKVGRFVPAKVQEFVVSAVVLHQPRGRVCCLLPFCWLRNVSRDDGWSVSRSGRSYPRPRQTSAPRGATGSNGMLANKSFYLEYFSVYTFQEISLYDFVTLSSTHRLILPHITIPNYSAKVKCIPFKPAQTGQAARFFSESVAEVGN